VFFLHTVLRSEMSRLGRSLVTPKVLYSNHLLLVVNKAAGWHSIPNNNDQTKKSAKCLVSFLQKERLGGGSDNTFLLPLHRLDQPCTGVLLLSKNKKAASRIQSNWKHHRKTYLARVDQMQHLYKASIAGQDGWMELQGHLSKTRKRPTQFAMGWSVYMERLAPLEPSRLCSIRWQVLDDSTIVIETEQGARHMIRALLSMANCPIIGDVRYGGESLPDGSVALHARQIQLADAASMALNIDQRVFSAPLPDTWSKYFGVVEEQVQQWEEESMASSLEEAR
jgi:23S rRNA pseudouridine1911/1915/1917 synthase